MILAINTCRKDLDLSYEEFLRPVFELVKERYEIMHYSDVDKDIAQKYDKIIIGGTALKDNDYMEHVEKFNWLKILAEKNNTKILGICAGAQIIAEIFGGKITKRKEIGVIEVLIEDQKGLPTDMKSAQVYALHNFSIELNNDFIVGARSKDCVQAFKLKDKEIYGVLFHPEVMNKEIIENF